MQATLPPGPRLPSLLQTIGWWNRPTVYVERLRARYGPRFTMRLLGQPPSVVLSDPEDLRELFAAAPDVLHPGEGRGSLSRSSAATRSSCWTRRRTWSSASSCCPRSMASACNGSPA